MRSTAAERKLGVGATPASCDVAHAAYEPARRGGRRVLRGRPRRWGCAHAAGCGEFVKFVRRHQSIQSAVCCRLFNQLLARRAHVPGGNRSRAQAAADGARVVTYRSSPRGVLQNVNLLMVRRVNGLRRNQLSACAVGAALRLERARWGSDAWRGSDTSKHTGVRTGPVPTAPPPCLELAQRCARPRLVWPVRAEDGS